MTLIFFILKNFRQYIFLKQECKLMLMAHRKPTIKIRAWDWITSKMQVKREIGGVLSQSMDNLEGVQLFKIQMILRQGIMSLVQVCRIAPKKMPTRIGMLILWKFLILPCQVV